MRKRKLKKAVIGAVVIGSASLYLLYMAAESSWLYYYSVDEFLQRYNFQSSQDDKPDGLQRSSSNRVRLAGWVKAGSIQYNADTMQLDFVLSGKEETLAIKYHGTVPVNFEPGREVLVEGKMGQEGIFLADVILTRCESKYKSKLTE